MHLPARPPGSAYTEPRAAAAPFGSYRRGWHGGYNGAMKALARLETILQDLVERPQWLLTPKRLHPLELAAAVTRAFEAQVLPVGDRVLAPNEVVVRLNPDDFAQFATVRRTLERELAMYLARAADERRLTLPAEPRVEIMSDSAVRGGSISVDAAFSEPPDSAAPQAAPAPLAGFTEKIERAAAGPFSPAAGTSATLDLLADSGRVLRSFPLDGPIVTIGRRSGNDIALLDLEVSRQHARIDFVAPRYYVSDVGSTNGTRVGGQPVKGRRPLADGDVIEIGRQRLRFRHTS